MKHYLHNSLRALFLSLAVLLSLPMLAVEVEIDGINYDLVAEAKQATVIRKSSGRYSGEVVIPEFVEYGGDVYSVTSIGDQAFSNYFGLTSVTIPNSVKSIGKYAFYNCSGLTSVTIPNSVTSIGAEAFRGCSGLTSVTIGNSVTSIGKYAFFNCSGLTSVTIPNSVTSIGENAFSYCSGLTSVHISDIAAWCNIDFAHSYSNPLYYAHHLYLNGEEVKDLVIPNSVTSIGNNAFYRCSGLTSVIIPNSVESIGDYAFAYCSGLTSVTIGNSVTSIGSSAFSGCSGLTSVTIPNSVTSIGSMAFANCSALTSVTIPNSVTSIGYQAFHKCSGLTSVTIGNSVTSIGGEAFYNCDGLTSVTIPNSVTSIGYEAFKSCSGLTSIVVEDGNPVYDSRNNCNAIIETETNTLHSGCKTTIIPNSVASIGQSAFAGCSGLTSVIIPNSVESIGDYAFASCSGLTSVTIPNSVTSIGNYAFYYCSGLTSVTIGNSVTSIGYATFSYCSGLQDVFCYAEKVPSADTDAFDGSHPENATLHVPAASIESYKSTKPWKSFGKIVGLSGGEPEQPEVPEVEKCATPVVTYAEGMLSFSCETEGANYVTKLVAEDAKEYYDAEIELSATYNIEVFAMKANCENSDTVNVALVWVENGNVDEETGVISVPATPVLIQGNGGVLNISGVAKGTEIVVYTVSGTEVARATAIEGTTTINTGLQSGTIVIVKFGNKSVKIKI